MSVNLFGENVSQPPVVNSGNKGVGEAWKLWCEITARPRQPTPDPFFAKKYRSARMNRISHDSIMDRVRAAAYLPPRPRDPVDVRRATMTITRDDLFSQGRTLQSEGHSVVAFSYEGDSGNDNVSSISDVETACGINATEWPIEEHAHCSRLLGYTPEKLEYAGDVARNEFGIPDVFPSHLVITKNMWLHDNNIAVKRVAGRRVNSRGRAEVKSIPSSVLSLDALARKKYLSGSSAEEVLRLHNLAPKGFWDDVEKEVNGGSSVAMAISVTEKKYGWSCNSR